MKYDAKFTTLSLQKTSFLFMKAHEYYLEVNPTGSGVLTFCNSKELQDDLATFREVENCKIKNYIDALKTVITNLYGFTATRLDR